jgi:hypothetical protein
MYRILLVLILLTTGSSGADTGTLTECSSTDTDTDADTLMGIFRYWPKILVVATHPENNAPGVRVKVLQLAEVVLRHGLIHPMSCIPFLIAMQV